MKQAKIRSVCECQSQLEALLDERRLVLAGFSIGPDGLRERAPAHSIEAQHQRFDVGWLCPYCGRNTLRSFSADALTWIDADPPIPATAPPVQPPAPPGPGPATGLSLAPQGVMSAPVPRASISPRPPAASGSNPPSSATAVALKSLTSPSRPSSVPPARPATDPTKTG